MAARNVNKNLTKKCYDYISGLLINHDPSPGDLIDSKAVAKMLDYYQQAILDFDELRDRFESIETKYYSLEGAARSFVHANNDWTEDFDKLKKEAFNDDK